MSNDTASPSAERILLEGPDAIAFAQAQFSSNLTALAIGHWQFSAWLSPQGRVRALFHLARLDEERLLLVLRGGQADALAEKLRRFVFRAKLRIEPLPALSLTTATALPAHTLEGGLEDLTLGCGDHGLRLHTGPGDSRWRALQIAQGWPWLPPAALDAHLPSALSLQRLAATALDKGCYPGQEIVARLHYRGGQKRHLRRLRIAADTTAGATLFLGEREVGQLLDVIGPADSATALAVLADEAAPALLDGAVTTNQGVHVNADGDAWPA